MLRIAGIILLVVVLIAIIGVVDSLRKNKYACADLQGADLRRAELKRANLRKADLKGTDLLGTTMPNGEIWSKETDLTEFTNPPDD